MGCRVASLGAAGTAGVVVWVVADSAPPLHAQPNTQL